MKYILRNHDIYFTTSNTKFGNFLLYLQICCFIPHDQYNSVKEVWEKYQSEGEIDEYIES